jgi:hypothetical protein
MRRRVGFRRALGAFGLIGALVTVACERRGGVASSFVSPNRTYAVDLTGHLAAPEIPIIEHHVRVTAHRGSIPLVRGHEVDFADWFDDGFTGKYGPSQWPQENVQRFVSIWRAGKLPDTIRVENRSRQAVSFLAVKSLDLFLLFDLAPGSVTSLASTAQSVAGDLSWIAVSGVWSNGAQVPEVGKNFDVSFAASVYEYVIAISDERVTVTQHPPASVTAPSRR